MSELDASSASRRHAAYATLSMRPLHILVFLSPLIVFYEIGSALYLTDPDSGAVRETIRAHALFSRLFELFGVGGAMFPGVAMIVVLLLWHVLARHRWRIRPGVLGFMTIESVAWTLPLLVLGQAIGLLALASVAGSAVNGPLGARATIAIGAGLYEELLFRMVAIALFHFILVDLFNMKDGHGKLIAIGLSAVAFALYHDDPTNFAFFAAAGVYFGAIYVYRGFGVVVATHAIYDLITLLI